MDVIVPIEISSRELLYKIFLCQLLASKGFRCYLGNKYNSYHLVNKLNGYIYLDKGYHKDESDLLYRKIKKNNGIIINLDDEGGVDFADGSTLNGRYSKSLFSFADLTFLWGKAQHKLISKNLSDKTKVEVVGHPRFELLSRNYHYLYKQEVSQITNKYKDFILINTNMSWGNNIRGDAFVSKNYGARFKSIDLLIALDKKKIKAYCSLVKELSKKTDKKIILRPHPEEDYSFYLNSFKDLKNVEVLYEGSVIPWLIAADCMIHPDCTTAVECLFVGKVPLSYLPEKYPKDLVTNLPIEASTCFTDETEIIAYIGDKKYLKKFTLGDYSFSEDYFSISKPTIKLIVDSFCEIRDNIHLSDSKKTEHLGLFLRNYVSSLRKFISRDKSHALSKNKLKGFNKNNCLKLHNLITTHHQNLSEIQCKPINSQLYVFKK
jgi:surface carbohydrate biosynthesis protein